MESFEKPHSRESRIYRSSQWIGSCYNCKCREKYWTVRLPQVNLYRCNLLHQAKHVFSRKRRFQGTLAVSSSRKCRYVATYHQFLLRLLTEEASFGAWSRSGYGVEFLRRSPDSVINQALSAKSEHFEYSTKPLRNFNFNLPAFSTSKSKSFETW